MAQGMQGKRVMVTGATNGIGEVTALELARMGAEVIVVSRNETKCQATVERIKKQTGNEHVSYITADLSSMDAIRACAQQFLSQYDRLDVLVNNAGGFFQQRLESVDGLELTFALNHMNYFLLTHELRDALRAGAEAHGEARIVNVASDAHRFSKLAINDLQHKQKYSGFGVYGESKLMNIMFTYELAKRLEGTPITVNALHPGAVKTGFGMNNSGFLIKIFGIIISLFGLTPEQGAETNIYLASSPEVKGISGKYWAKKKQSKSSNESHDETLWKRLWDESVKLAGVEA